MSREFNLFFNLLITAEFGSKRVRLRLQDGNGNELAEHIVDFSEFLLSEQQALFNLRNFVELYKSEGVDDEAAAVKETGVLIALRVLGKEIFGFLNNGKDERLLRVVLPAPADTANGEALAGMLARIPWEMARLGHEYATLSKNNLRLCIVHPMQAPDSRTPTLATSEALRVLFVFAEARGSTPLGMRQERRSLQALFQNHIEGKRNVMAHFLAHGVTRMQLADQISAHGGYHIVHWSGHGQQNTLELAAPGGTSDLITGQELLALFQQPACIAPRLCFLSACHSGDSEPIHNWEDFLHEQERGRRTRRAAANDNAAQREASGLEQPALTGTAQALLAGGVPSVVAMRFAVGDHYARELALAFYSALLVNNGPKSVAGALMQARKLLLTDQRFSPCDHATPLLFGAEQTSLEGLPGSAPQAVERCLAATGTGGFAVQANFVGRTWELAALGSEVMDVSSGKVAALITGIGGIGKTAFVAEVVDIWQSRFDWVLLFQAKPNPLQLGDFFLQVHMHLDGEFGHYHEHVKTHPEDAIFLSATNLANLTIHWPHLVQNLLRAMHEEAILLVLDNFETNLKSKPEPDTALWACNDPHWDQIMIALTQGLKGSRSRLILTCRRPLLALAALIGTPDAICHQIPLGPLPAGEAHLYLSQHSILFQMLFSECNEESLLARRLLQASRFYPLWMERLAHLAANPLRLTLLNAIELLESGHSYDKLPEIFSNINKDTFELDYLTDALIRSTDELIDDVGQEARRVLWIVSLANEPLENDLLRAVWNGEDLEMAIRRNINHIIQQTDQSNQDIVQFLQTLGNSQREKLQNLPTHVDKSSSLAPLLQNLRSLGLLQARQAHTSTQENDIALTCHELVRERITRWATDQPDCDPNTIRRTLAERLATSFLILQKVDPATASQLGQRALVYCIQAKEYSKLGDFAINVINSIRDVRQLQILIHHLRKAAAAAMGQSRWECLGYLADALRNSGQSESSLTLYAEAANLARPTDDSGDWGHYACLCGSWGNALFQCSNLPAAREQQNESLRAHKKAGSSQVEIIGRELEIVRISFIQGEIDQFMPIVTAKLNQLQIWWQQHIQEHAVKQIPNMNILGDVFVAALNIATHIACAKEDFQTAAQHLETSLEIKRVLQCSAYDIGVTKINHARVLIELGEFLKPKRELEDCLSLFHADPAKISMIRNYLASLFARNRDFLHASNLARQDLAICNNLADIQRRAAAHSNLAGYLERRGEGDNTAEFSYHQLAGFLYLHCANYQENSKILLYNYAVDFRQSNTAQRELFIPTILHLLEQPDFHALKSWLTGWLKQEDMGMERLQAQVDEILAQVRQNALGLQAQ